MTYNVLQTMHGKIIVAEDRVSSLGSVLGESRIVATLKGGVGSELSGKQL